MQNIGELLRTLRKKEGYPLRKVAAFLDIDQAILSKIERGQRRLTKEQVIKLADFFNYSKKEMLISFLSDRIIYEIGNEDYAKEALKVAEEKIEYKKISQLNRNEIMKKIALTLKKYSKVSSAWVYGSFSRKDDGPASDIDIAIKTEENFSYFDLAEIQFHLERMLNRKVDIGFIESFKPYILKNIRKDLKLIYER